MKVLVTVICAVLIVIGCTGQEAKPNSTIQVTPSVPPASNIATIPTSTIIPSQTLKPTTQPTQVPAKGTIVPTQSPEFARTPTPIPDPTATPPPKQSLAPEPTATPTEVPLSTPTPAPTPTFLPTVTPTLEPIVPYDGPLFDTHLHLGFKVRKGRFETAHALCGYLEEKKVDWAIAFYPTQPTSDPNRVPSNQVIRDARTCVAFLIHPLNPSKDKEFFGSFVEGLYGEQELRSLLEPEGMFQGVGELSMNLGALGGLSYEHPAVNTVFQVVNEMGGTVMIHPPDGRSGPPDLHNLERSIRQYPNINFLIHTSKDWAFYMKAHVFPLMARYPNLYFTLDVSKFLQTPGNASLMFRNQDSGQFLADVESIGFDSMLKQAVESALPMFDKYPDRIMWGTDLGIPWHYDAAVQDVVFSISRRLIAHLPTQVQEPYAYGNALRVFGPYFEAKSGNSERTTIIATPAPRPTPNSTLTPTLTPMAVAAIATKTPELAAICSFDEPERRLSCHVEGQSGGQLKWTSNVSTRGAGTETYEVTFGWGEFFDEIQVQVEECDGSNCSLATTTFDVELQPRGDCPTDFTGWFTTFPLPNLSDIYEVGPPGRILDNDYKGHGYFRVPNGQNLVNVRMPIDATLYAGSVYLEPDEPQYLLFFRTACEGLWFLFDHIREPVRGIAELFPDDPPVNDSGTYEVGPLEMKEGDLLGTSIGTLADGNAFVDFGVDDDFGRLPTPQHPNAHGRFLSAVCIYKFFDPDIAAYLKSVEHPQSVAEEGLCP